MVSLVCNVGMIMLLLVSNITGTSKPDIDTVLDYDEYELR
jgi:hypothetical protein